MGSFIWLGAVATFGVGDVLTTMKGLEMTGVEEAHPLSEVVLGVGGPTGMILMKALVFAGAFYAYENVAPKDWRVGIPIGLTVLGTLIVMNNLLVISAAA